MYRLYFTKVPAILPTGPAPIKSCRRIRRLRKGKSANRSGKYYEALHTFISKKPSLLPRGLRRRLRGGKKKERKSLSEQHSTISQARHVAQYWNMREVKVCKYHLIAESCSWCIGRATSAGLPIAVASERKKPRLQTVSANPKRVICRNYTWTWPFRAWPSWTNGDGRKTVKVLTLVCVVRRSRGNKERRWYYDKIFTDRNRRGKEFSASTTVISAAVSRM